MWIFFLPFSLRCILMICFVSWLANNKNHMGVWGVCVVILESLCPSVILSMCLIVSAQCIFVCVSHQLRGIGCISITSPNCKPRRRSVKMAKCMEDAWWLVFCPALTRCVHVSNSRKCLVKTAALGGYMMIGVSPCIEEVCTCFKFQIVFSKNSSAWRLYDDWCFALH